MLIFLNDDKPYIYWITHHRRGFVIDGRRKPKLGHLALHRATCSNIRTATSKRTHWTSGGRFKACSPNREELEAWANEETQQNPVACPDCRPDQDEPADSLGQVHLTKLGRDILDYVLDAALIHFEDAEPPYRLTVSDIAACMGKTPGQITPVLHTMIEDRVLTVHGKDSADTAIRPRQIVLPTIKGIKTLSTFANEPDESIAAALDNLAPS
jgi:hypothetical protein